MLPTATRNSAPRIGPMPGRLVRIRASGRAKNAALAPRRCSLDALLEGEDFSCELCHYARGYLLCRQSNALGSGCAKCLVRYVRGPFDAAGPQVSSDALVACSSKLLWGLVVGEEGKG